MTRLAARLLPLLVALLAGVAQALAMATPWNGQPLWWLQILSLAVLGGLLQREAAAGRGFLLGWVFATAWLAATWWWLFISMHTFGGLAAPLAALAVLGLAAFLALYYAVACGAFVALTRTKSTRGAIVFVACWTLAALARARWLTGFPWGAGGYAHVDGLLAGYAPWLGAYGLGAVAAWVAATLPRLLQCGRWQRVVLLAVLTLPSVAQMGGSGSSRSA